MRVPTLSIVAGASTLAGALALVAPALAHITVNRSIGGIGLGMTTGEVRARLGAPTLSTATGGSRDLVYRDRGLVVTLSGSRVVIVSTRNRHERTARGVGPGSTLGALRARLPSARCGEKAGVAFCRTGSIRPGRRSTTFQMEGGRVVTVTVARGMG